MGEVAEQDAAPALERESMGGESDGVAGHVERLGVVVFAAPLVGIAVATHNFDGIVTRPLLARDDRILSHFCETAQKRTDPRRPRKSSRASMPWPAMP